ncbi:YkvA family protein [Cohnella ginsengisoli]|uniref:YkvA family protein n=1 Tax=Cohnella ginsengisoli TaxID=425004 RepID=A0A9X4KFT9_9BACL|nr:YkvA family protein [Cohnella ginsengisoli]MDG0791155.1 YkvA family protein [Cohnella ginsengisoli]
MIQRIKSWAKELKRKVFVLYFAYRDERTPWYAKMFAICVVAYAFSPIDLIPDFVPVLGYLDDVILVPLGVALALKMIPNAVIQECSLKAETRLKSGKPKNWLAGSIIILLWIVAFLWISFAVYRRFSVLHWMFIVHSYLFR